MRQKTTAWQIVVAVGLGTIAIACSRPPKIKTPEAIVADLKPSLVKISYGDKGGHGTGFFVEGEDGVCTVLTAAHVVDVSDDLNLTVENKPPRKANRVVRLPDVDLAVVTFVPDGSICPYTSLPLGDSDAVKFGDRLLVAGYPDRAGQDFIVDQFAPADVTKIQNPPLPEGYGISYDATTAGGMSGGPVVNVHGEVIGVHGLTDAEIVQLGEAIQGSLSDQQAAEIAAASDRVARVNTFKWAIPINFYIKKIEDAYSVNTQTISRSSNSISEPYVPQKNSDEWYNDGEQLLENRQYEEAIVAYTKAIELDPNSVYAWNGRANSLRNLGRHEEALVDYGKAVELDPNSVYAWNGRGNSLRNLGRYEEALAAYDRAIEIDPGDAYAWNGRGNSFRDLSRYEEALAAYDQAIEIDPGDAYTWYKRSFPLVSLERHQAALESVEKALEVNPNYQKAKQRREEILERIR